MNRVTRVPLRVLILEDRLSDAELMLHELRRAGFDPVWQRVDSEPQYLSSLRPELDVILADHALPDFNSLRALALLRESKLDIPFIVVSGSIGEDLAVAAMRQGAADYLLKDRLARLGPAVAHAIEQQRLREDKLRAERHLEEEASISAALARVGRELISSADTTVLLDRLCQVLTAVLECDCSYVLMLVPGDGGFAVRAGHGHTPEDWEAARALTVPSAALAPVLARLNHTGIADVDIPRFARTPLGQFALGQNLTRALIVSLRRGEEVIGLQIAATRARRDPFGVVHQRIAQGSAQLASLALENARLVEELERANRLKSDFVGAMSHELRTPLNAVLGYTYLLQKQEYGPLSSEQETILEHIHHSGTELRELIDAMLDINRLEAGRLPLELSEVRLAELFAALQPEVDALRKEPGLQLSWELADGLPPLHTDRVKLKVVIKSLIANALKFTKQGSVRVCAQPCDGGVEICVADTGIGIPAEALPVIFEPFRQLSGSPARRYSGVGLGLYIARRFVDLLGGTIAVDSAVGKGSTFRVQLPPQLSRTEKT